MSARTSLLTTTTRVLCVAVGLHAGWQVAEAAAPPAPAPIDFSKIEITTTKLADNVYALDGQGGRISVLVGPDGVFMVDSQFAPLTDKIVTAIKGITDKPIRFLVNTHLHPDHVGGNENLGKLWVTIIAQEKLRGRLAAPVPVTATNAGRPATPAIGLPLLTYSSSLALHMNGEDVEVLALPPAHTDGDTFVKFVKADVVATGDVYRSVGFPNIDRANGGTLAGMLSAFDIMIAASGPATKVVPGHGPITDRAGLVTHRDLIVTVRDRVSKLMKEGKTVEEIVAAKPTADYDERTGNAAASADRFVQQLYAELSTR